MYAGVFWCSVKKTRTGIKGNSMDAIKETKGEKRKEKEPASSITKKTKKNKDKPRLA